MDELLDEQSRGQQIVKKRNSWTYLCGMQERTKNTYKYNGYVVPALRLKSPISQEHLGPKYPPSLLLAWFNG